MNFIQGQFLFRSKCISPLISFIYKLEIVNYSEMILEGDHILTDDLGKIMIFNCKKGSKEFKGIIKYWSSTKRVNLEFELKPKGDKEDNDLIYILINGIYYFIFSKPSPKPIISIWFKNEKLCFKGEEGGEDGGRSEDDFKGKGKCKDDLKDPYKEHSPYTPLYHSYSLDSIQILYPLPLNSTPLLDFIILNLPSSCSSHSSLSYFCFSNFNTFFGFIFSYFLEDYHYFSILLLSDFYNPINLIQTHIHNFPLFPNNCFLISKNNKELYFSNFINLNYNFPLDFFNKVKGSILNEERICFKSKKDLFLKIMYFLKQIEPFKWSHSLIISKKIEKKLKESPLPFIYGEDECGSEGRVEGGSKVEGDGDKEEGVGKEGVNLNPNPFDPALNHPTLNEDFLSNDLPPTSLNNPLIQIDLDSFTILNPPSLSNFPLDFTLRLSNFLDLKKKLILELFPDQIQDFLLFSHKYFLNDKILIYPEDDYFSFFLKKFTSTRMFIRFLVEERFTPINYIYDLHFKKIEIIPFKNIKDYKIEEVIEKFKEIYDLENDKYNDKGFNKDKKMLSKNDKDIDHFNYNHFYNNLRRLSIQKDFKSISNLIKRKPLTLKESQKINIYEEQRNLKIKEKDYEGMYFVNICDYENEGCKDYGNLNGKWKVEDREVEGNFKGDYGKDKYKLLDWIKDQIKT